jgi:hypothetical protein
MSETIDWTKPLRVGRYPATVVREDHGRRHITWNTFVNGRADAFVDSFGNLLATLHGGDSRGVPFVENVPEEPANCIHVYRDALTRKWEINAGGDGVEGQLRSRRYWEMKGDGGVIVEVPVPK